jgi:hypothetical protein
MDTPFIVRLVIATTTMLSIIGAIVYFFTTHIW